MNKFCSFYVSQHVTVIVTSGDILNRNWRILSFDEVPGPFLIKFAEYSTLHPFLSSTVGRGIKYSLAHVTVQVG